jgi:hypothetical protein
LKTFHSSARRALARCALPCVFACALASLQACGASFDTIGQLEGVRVMGVSKSSPTPKPGESVELQMLLHDTGPAEADAEREATQVLWLSGCVNPPADLFQGCFAQFGQVLGGLGLDPEAPLGDPEDNQMLLGELAEAGIGLGFGEKFTLDIPEDLITRRPPPSPGVSPYGLSYVFFAACAGTLLPDATPGAFPIACEDERGERVGARDFVAGYTSLYSYTDTTNTNPSLLGFAVNGKKLTGDSLCIGEECETLAWDAPRKCDGSEPVVAACADEREPLDCPTMKFEVLVDPKSVDDDPILTRDIGEESTEQMWVNFHADRGQFQGDVSLVNDSSTGFRDKVEGEFVSPEAKGKTHVWAVVRDNRGGTTWGRFDVCVK